MEELAKLLEFPHQQVRQEAQFELASRKPEATAKVFAGVLKDSKNQLARLHAVWGLGILVQKNPSLAASLVTAVAEDKDVEVDASSLNRSETWAHTSPAKSRRIRLANDQRFSQAVILGAFADPDDRVSAAAAVAYGKIHRNLDVVIRPGSEQLLRPAVRPAQGQQRQGSVPPARGGDGSRLRDADAILDLWNAWKLAKGKYDVPAVRMGVLLALRKHESDKVAEFLTDAEPRIVAEAARAIYDDRMMDSFPALAKLAESTAQPDAVAFRALAANFWLGTSEAATRIARFAGRASEPDYTRAFALDLLGDWGDPADATRSPASR